MKYDVGMEEEVDVPEGLLEIFQKVGVEGCKRDCEKCDLFEECLYMFINENRFDIYPDNIYPRDIAEFTVDCISKEDDFFGRPTFSTRIEVGEWVVVACEQLPHPEDAKNWEPYMLAFKSSAQESKEDERTSENYIINNGDTATLITMLIMKNLMEINNEFKETDNKSEMLISLTIGWSAAKAILDSKKWRDKIPYSMLSLFKDIFQEAGLQLDQYHSSFDDNF